MLNDADNMKNNCKYVRACTCVRARSRVHEYAPVFVSAHINVGLGSIVFVELLSPVKNIILFET